MSRLEEWKERFEKRLREIFKPQGPPKLVEAMGYYLFQEGKRVRPLMVVATASALGGNERDAITVGCALEMIHNYSLIHDDLPAMDNDDFRRGLPSCHKKFGEALAILAGDALLTYAFELITDTKNFESLSSDTLLEIALTLAKRAGSGGMVGGQVLDIQNEKDLDEVNKLKTGALFEASFELGGLIAGRRELLKDLKDLGKTVGLLFQITDDIIDEDGYVLKEGKERALSKAKGLYERAKELNETILNGNEEISILLDKIYRRALS